MEAHKRSDFMYALKCSTRKTMSDLECASVQMYSANMALELALIGDNKENKYKNVRSLENLIGAVHQRVEHQRRIQRGFWED